jgi:hypothetical protein
MLTGDVQKQKYIYYRCTGNRGKCDLPRFKKEVLSERLGEPLKGLQVPPEIVAQILAILHEDQNQAANKLEKERARLESRLTSIRNRMDSAYVDKLDGKIPEDFWERKMIEWRTEEQQVKLALDGLASAESTNSALDAQRVFQLANKAYLLYFSQDSAEKAKLLRMMCSNFSVDAAIGSTPEASKRRAPACRSLANANGTSGYWPKVIFFSCPQICTSISTGCLLSSSLAGIAPRRPLTCNLVRQV